MDLKVGKSGISGCYHLNRMRKIMGDFSRIASILAEMLTAYFQSFTSAQTHWVGQ